MHPTKLKLALVSSGCDWGDSEKVLWGLGTGFLAREHHVLWVCDERSAIFAQVRKLGFNTCPLSDPASNPIAFLNLRRACITNQVQLVLANDSLARTWGALVVLGRLGIKRFQYKHTLKPPSSLVPYNWMLDQLVCASSEIRDVCSKRGLMDHKLKIIEVGMELPRFEKWKERLWICESLNIPQQTPLFCSVLSSTDDELQSLSKLIEAANHLRWHMPEFCILVLYNSNATSELQRLTIKYSLHEHIRLVPNENAERWICASDVLVQHTTSLGYCLPAIQAQMMGTQVVLFGLNQAELPLHAAMVMEDGPGWICKGNDPGVLANSMAEAAQDNTMNKVRLANSMQSARKRYQQEQMVLRFEAMFLDAFGLQQNSHSSEVEWMKGNSGHSVNRRAG